MSETQDLSDFAAFDLDDLLSEIESNKSKKEVTAYLDRAFLARMINEYHAQQKLGVSDFGRNNKINLVEYNFTGADFRRIRFSDFALCDFKDCDISSVRLDRQGIDFFRELMLNGTVTAQGLNLEGAYLGPVLTVRSELGIACYINLNLSNMDLTGTNFSKCDMKGVLFENTNISGCDFLGCKNLDPKQLAFTIGAETALFDDSPEKNFAFKKQIKIYSETLDPVAYYAPPLQKTGNKIIAFLARITNFFDN
ncbi:MAG: pentapeptide repeat-containing protein [Rickettsiales bacterium]|jgi:uncharacterized protein YjbI with pentapeptide repeats|nr:pentapeptide repeat-containing protein [Rickettsiales bacterium]